MTDPTLAQQSLIVLAADRAKEHARLFDKTRNVPRVADWLVGAQPVFDRHPDLVEKALLQTAAPIQRVIPRVLGDELKREPALLAFGSVPDNEIGATMSVYPDGSGRILLADAILGLCNQLAALATITALPSTAFGVWRSSRRWRSGRPAGRGREGRSASYARVVALRYYVLHQRIFGVSATLGVVVPKANPRLQEMLRTLAATFILAHEAAHFCLGHQPSAAPDPAIEFEADYLALRVLEVLVPNERADHATGVALTAARLALVGLELSEKGLFVRLSGTHPAASERWARLAAHDSVAAEGASLLTADLARGATAAQDVRMRLPRTTWQAGYSHPALRCDIHGTEYYRMIPDLDQLGTGSPDDPYGMIIALAEQGEPDVEPAVRAIREENVGAALVSLGVEGLRVDQICAPEQALSFWTLMDAVYSSSTLAHATNTTIRQVLALSVSTLCAGAMQGLY